MQPEFVAYRQLAEQATWEVTPLWCYRCGKQRLLGKRVPSEGKLLLKCPVCNPGEHQLLNRSEHPLLHGMKSYKPMLAKLRNWSHEHYRAALSAYFGGGTIGCETCGLPLIVLFAPIDQLPDWLQAVLWDWQWSDEVKLVNTFCPRCQTTCNTSLAGLVLALPEARAFAQTHGKLTEGWTDFALKGGNLIRRVGIDHPESGKTPPEADRYTPFLQIREESLSCILHKPARVHTKNGRDRFEERLSIYQFICSDLASLKLKEAIVRRNILP